MRRKVGAISVLFALIFSVLSFSGCSDSSRVVVNTPSSTAADGLDLQAVGELVKTSKNAEELETALNKPGGVNNLDLDEDDKVDYINVTEFGDTNAKGFSLTVDLGNGNVQEVATINIEKDTANTANVQLQGDPTIYGDNHYYHSHMTLSDLIIYSWLFSPRPLYISPYHYGYYPGWYGYYAPVPMATYRSSVSNVTRTSTIRKTTTSNAKSNIKSPNSGKSANNIKAPLSKPTTSQKSFQERNPSKQIKSGGFGSKSSQPSKSSSGSSKPSSGSSKPSSGSSRPSSSGRRK